MPWPFFEASVFVWVSCSEHDPRSNNVDMFEKWEIPKIAIQSGWWMLVVWNMNFIFPYIGNVIIPTDELIFFIEVGQPLSSMMTSGLEELKNLFFFREAPWRKKLRKVDCRRPRSDLIWEGGEVAKRHGENLEMDGRF